jgi:hypothetical protein
MERKYFVVTRKQVAGFFSNFFWALQGSITARESGLTPILQLGMQPGDSSRGRENPDASWSKYFSVLDSSNSTRIPENLKTFLDESDSRPAVRTFDQLVEGFSNTMPLRPEVIQMMDEDAKVLGINEKHRVLGVHFRGTDMNWHPEHPTPPSKAQMIRIINQTLVNDNFDLVFVATDTPSFVKSLRKQLKTRVLSFSGMREEVQQGTSTASPVFRVLRDSWILSKCQVLIHSESNVSSASRLFKGVEFEERIEIKLGNNPTHFVFSALNYLWRVAVPESIRNEKVTPVIFRRELI